MADTSLDIIIRTIAEGNGAQLTGDQLKELKKQAEGAGEESKKAGDALNKLADENIARVRAATAGATEAQKENTQAVQQGASASLGLGAAVTVAFGAMVAALQSYTAEVAAAGIEAEGFGKILTAAESLRTVHAQMATEAERFARSYAEVTTSIKDQTEAINAQASALMAKQRIEEKLNGAKLNRKIKEIEGDNSKTPEQKRIDIEDLTNAARKVKEDNRLKAEKDKIDADRREQLAAAATAKNAKAEAEALQPKVEQTEREARGRGRESARNTKAAEKKMEKNDGMIELINTLTTGDPNSLAARGTMAMNREATGNLSAKFGTGRDALIALATGGKSLGQFSDKDALLKMKQNLLDENEGLDAQIDNSASSAANARNKADRAKDEQKGQRDLALRSHNRAEQLNYSTTSQYHNLGQEMDAQPALNAQLDGASEAVKKKARDDRDWKDFDAYWKDTKPARPEREHRPNRHPQTDEDGNPIGGSGGQGSAVDMSGAVEGLASAAEGAGTLTTSIQAFAEGTVALHEATANKLDEMLAKIGNLESRFNDRYA